MILILYDGECMFCEGGVNFVVKNRKDDEIRLMPIQFSNLNGSDMMLESEVPSMLVIDTKKSEFKFDATASLVVMSRLKGFVGLFGKVLDICPKIIANFFYRLIGRNRHKIFGRKDYCNIPAGSEKKLFIENENDFKDFLKSHNVSLTQINKIINEKYT